MTRTAPGRARGARGQFGLLGVSNIQSSEARKTGPSGLDSAHPVPNFRRSEVLPILGAIHRLTEFRTGCLRGHRHPVAGTSRGCSRIGNRRGKLRTPFSPVPPPLPGCAGFPTSRPQQVDYGRLGRKEVAVGQGKRKERKRERNKRGEGQDDAADKTR